MNGRGGARPCARCGEQLAPAVFVEDLQATLRELGQDYRLDPDAQPAGHLTELCPRCKRVARARGYFGANGTTFAR